MTYQTKLASVLAQKCQLPQIVSQALSVLFDEDKLADRWVKIEELDGKDSAEDPISYRWYLFIGILEIPETLRGGSFQAYHDLVRDNLEELCDATPSISLQSLVRYRKDNPNLPPYWVVLTDAYQDGDFDIGDLVFLERVLGPDYLGFNFASVCNTAVDFSVFKRGFIHKVLALYFLLWHECLHVEKQESPLTPELQFPGEYIFVDHEYSRVVRGLRYALFCHLTAVRDCEISGRELYDRARELVVRALAANDKWKEAYRRALITYSYYGEIWRAYLRNRLFVDPLTIDFGEPFEALYPIWYAPNPFKKHFSHRYVGVLNELWKALHAHDHRKVEEIRRHAIRTTAEEAVAAAIVDWIKMVKTRLTI